MRPAPGRVAIGKLATIGLVIALVFAALIVTEVALGLGTGSSESNTTQSSSSATTSCSLTPYDYSLNDTRYISNSTNLWNAGNWVAYDKLPAGMGLYIGYSSNSSVTLTGAFESTGPIYMSVMTADQLNHYSTATSIWSSSLSTSSSLNVQLQSGTYYVVFHNPGTSLVNMTISQSIVAHYPGC